ncbi:MAG: F-type H+-transporting ATPase subunit b [Rhodospirillaceae bacterium]|jgi:F-type H+-transporting ATPase subunit b|nr:F-type H+-transporting ATPase subunit b [Rhodospirillaceae bacterium]
MPQLVFADFAPQLVWLAITFVALYVILSRLVLPRIAGTLASRENRLQGDLAQAEKLRADAEAALVAYQKTMSDARAAAQTELKQAAAEMAAEAAKRESAFAAEVNARVKAAESTIAAAKQAALAGVRNVASEAARELVARLAGIEPAPEAVAAAVDAAQREHA